MGRLPAIIAILAALSVPTPAVATDLFDSCAENGASRFERGYSGTGDTGAYDYYTAMDTCTLALAEAPDDSHLQAWLGVALVHDGQADKAAPLLEASASMDNVVAKRALGDLLILGKGTGRDAARGLELLRQAADAGFAPAALSLAYSYEFGDGVARDDSAATEWYRQAASAGMTRAQVLLARNLAAGRGVVRDEAAAFELLDSAAAAGDREAQYRLGVALLEGRGVAADPIAAASAFASSADQYYGPGLVALGYVTELGLGVPANVDDAEQFYESGRSSNSAIAKHNLARLRETSDPAGARQLYLEAARAGEMRAAVNLALMMLQGAGGARDITGALDWTQKAADAGLPSALNNLGRFYELGIAVGADAARARELYSAAAALGYQPAVENAARLGG